MADPSPRGVRPHDSRRSRSGSLVSWSRDLSPTSEAHRPTAASAAVPETYKRRKGSRNGSFSSWYRDLSPSPERVMNEKAYLLDTASRRPRSLRFIYFVVATSLLAVGLLFCRPAFSPSTCASHRPLDPSGNTTYLAYLPHGDQHSQRNALINSLTLAALLDRTLLMPPLLLGKTTQWLPADQLQAELVLWSAAECDPVQGQARMRWSELFTLPEGVRIVARDDLTPAFMAGFGAGEVEYVPDSSQFGSRIVEDPAKRVPKRKFADVSTLSLPSVRSSPARILHFGSLHGVDRLALASRNAFELHAQHVRASIPSNPTLLAAAAAAVAILGDDFRAAHLRLGDSPFTPDGATTMDAALSDLLKGGKPKMGQALFLATDSPDHQALVSFKERWPRTFFLSNFSRLDEVKAARQMQGGGGGPVGQWMEGLVEGLVCARSEIRPVGIQGDAMSEWIREVLWPASGGKRVR